MIARISRGSAKTSDAAGYVSDVLRPVVEEHARARGNRGAWILRREDRGRTEFVMLSMWESIDALDHSAVEGPRSTMNREDRRDIVDWDEAIAPWEVEAAPPPPGYPPCQHLLPSRARPSDGAPLT
jgi:hypothetical protein